MNILHLILGAIVLLFGRSLFWLFVAIVGFLVGFEIAQQFAADQAAGVQILIGLGLGAIGALVAMFAQRLGFAIAGFYAGGYLGVAAAQSITLPSDPMVWFVIGGVIGALVAFMMMDWAIVVLSSFVGAGTITAALGSDSTTSAILFIVLAAIGIIFQGRRLQGQAPALQTRQTRPRRSFVLRPADVNFRRGRNFSRGPGVQSREWNSVAFPCPGQDGRARWVQPRRK